ncbi:hypothetical protein ACK4SH_19830, partial [Proteus mirabilis]
QQLSQSQLKTVHIVKYTPQRPLLRLIKHSEIIAPSLTKFYADASNKGAILAVIICITSR